MERSGSGRNSDDDTPLASSTHSRARRGVAGRVRSLGVRDRRARALGQTPLGAATKANSIEIALRLLDAGADPNAKDSIEDSAFLYAGAEGFNDILLATLTHGADVTSLTRFAGTALIPASEHAHVETVRILIDAGVPLDHMNNFGWTALHEAIVLGDGGEGAAQVVRMLLEAGADPRLPSGGGDSPRNLAAGEGYWNLVAVIDQFLAG